MGSSGRPDPDLLQKWVIHGQVPPGDVGGQLGSSRSTGYNWLHRYAITPAGPALSQADLIDRWRAGEPVEHIAADTGVPRAALLERLISAAQIQPSRRYIQVGSPDDPLSEHRLREWHVRQGLTAPQIAALAGTTARQVGYRLTRYRLSQRRPGPPGRLPELLPPMS